MCNILQYKSVKIIPFTPITDIKLCPTATGSFKGKFLYYWEDLLTPYKRGGYEYIAFVPATPGSELLKDIEESIENNKMKVKVVEQPGQKIINILKMSSKKSGAHERCEEELCLMCSQDKSGNCKTSEILYQIECLDCKANNKKSIYIGESQKNGLTRGSQHLEDSLAVTRRLKYALSAHIRINYMTALTKPNLGFYLLRVTSK